MGSSPSKRSDAVEDIRKEKPGPVEKWAEHVDRSKPADDLDLKDEIPKKGGGKRQAKVVPTSDPVVPKGGKLKLTEGVVQDYINIEKAINRLERKNVLKKFESQTIYADNLKNTVEQLEAVLKELKKQTERERTDLKNIEQPSVRDFLKQQGQWDDRYLKEKSEYEDAMVRQETVQKELNIARVNYDNAVKIQEIYKQQTDNLNGLYEEQDKMLEAIFGTDYASEKENVLEGEVDDMVDWQQRVSLAMFKWANGRVLLVHALTQLTFGINRWQDVQKIEKENERGRYFAAAEARNNFVAAAQNVQSCRMYLNKVDFPYGTEKEIALLEDTVNKAFRTVDNDSEMKKALKVFQETQQKVASLIQWFDKVINDTIRKDLDQANNELIKKQKALREERLTLMKKLAKAQLDVDMKIEYDDVADDELERELKELERQALRDVEKLKEADVQGILDLSKQGGNVVTPLNKLAPLPSKDALFGDVKQKLDEYDETRKQFERRNNLQREKQAMALQEKLKLRQQKNRRNRKERRDSIGASAVDTTGSIGPTAKSGKKKTSGHH
ncbi:hypothetical protein B9Z55_001665 [Caenorhabditis nigoni]|uniref:Uncharacterized protein n=1 Tax=Caenorhabditis nigoni TaxID=1611254 RepID=A0A2G5VH35_9PELO|nr:hypothetical protein B9Z55_001665 [Caenorhabditis nigoni]